MNLNSRVRLWLFPCLLAVASLAFAQGTPQGSTAPAFNAPPPTAHVSSLDGSATLDREGQSEPLTAGLPLVNGDRVRTEGGRVEVLFTDGTALHLDEFTTVDVLAQDLLRLFEGRVYILAAGSRDPSRAVRYQIDAPAASVRTDWPGQYRMTASGGRVELAVVSGEATLATEAGAVTVRAGERAYATEGQAPSAPEYFNSARWDTFDRWSAARHDEWAGTTSGQYLPTELRPYSGTFERYGTWRNEPSVGNVWYPAVQDDWRPYYQGYWRPYDSWGSVWIGLDPWDWATHHYGRWGFSLSWGWYWIPGRTWGPGWVSWSTASGYVSWCALGFHDGPVFGLWGLRGSVYGSRLDPWRGWTVVPRHAFGGRNVMAHVAVDGRRLDSRIRTSFAVHRRQPEPDIAVRRSWANSGASARPGGRGAGPTNGIPPAVYANRSGGAVSRFGRADGTGLSRPIDSVSGGGQSAPRGRRPFPAGASPSYEPRSSVSPGASGFPSAGSGARSRSDATPGASGMRFPDGSSRSGDTPRVYRSPGASDVSRPDAAPRSYGSPRSDESPRSYRSPGASENSRTYPPLRSSESPRLSGSPRAVPRTYESPQSYESPRSYASPGASGIPRRDDTSRSFESPRTTDSPRATPRTYDAPRSTQPPRSATPPGASGMPRRYDAPRSSETPRSADTPRSYSFPGSSRAPRGSDSPRSYDTSRSTPRSYDAPRMQSSPRNDSGPNSSGSRYNPGTAGSRDGARSSAPARRRSREP